MKIILAIESSCDETSVAVVKDGRYILSNVVSSQIKAHKRHGGVVPELASRLHAESIHYVLEKALTEASVSLSDLDAIAVTMGPGLEGSLIVGLSVAKSLSVQLNIPLIPVNHIHGHIYAHIAAKTPVDYPCLALIVSGGHSEFIRIDSAKQFHKCGKTRDDAAGEVLDKVARYLNLGYPGGPVIEKEASNGDSSAFRFTMPMKHVPFEFSFSGLKTAAIDLIDSLDDSNLPVQDICASFQKAIIDCLIYKSLEACDTLGIKHLLIAGGVTANQSLQQSFELACQDKNIGLTRVDSKLCTDNAAMIGLAGYHLQQYYDVKDAAIFAQSGLSV